MSRANVVGVSCHETSPFPSCFKLILVALYKFGRFVEGLNIGGKKWGDFEIGGVNLFMVEKFDPGRRIREKLLLARGGF
jgi:hypothetical protein